jgi:hypothetical protein
VQQQQHQQREGKDQQQQQEQREDQLEHTPQAAAGPVRQRGRAGLKQIGIRSFFPSPKDAPPGAARSSGS